MNRYLDRREASAFLRELGFRVQPATLAKFVTIGGGPTIHHFGRTPLYTPEELTAWAHDRLSKNEVRHD
jgi:hypothetical protein